MRILVIGSGGREHALCWKIAQSPLCEKLYVAPGNVGMADLAELLPIPVNDNAALLKAALQLKIDLTVVGPDDVLAAGLVDLFLEHSLTVFGPTRKAAQLEWSKEFSKGFMQRHGIPTASWKTCSNPDEVQNVLDEFSFPVFLKASGLALGKGAIFARNQEEADRAVTELVGLGAAAKTLVIEEYLIGREVTLLAFSDGKRFALMPPAEDHKQIFDNDQGPNTGGMGVIAPPYWMNDDHLSQVQREIVQPTLEGLLKEGLDFRGILYFGLMMTADGPKLLEYNARFGDPETQTLLLLLESDLVPLMLACAKGELDGTKPSWHNGVAACVVLASPGYPSSSTKGLPISGLDQLPEGIVPFFSAVLREDDCLKTNGGRVLALSTQGQTHEEVLDRVYSAVEQVSFEGKQFRRDIGRRRRL